MSATHANAPPSSFSSQYVISDVIAKDIACSPSLSGTQHGTSCRLINLLNMTAKTFVLLVSAEIDSVGVFLFPSNTEDTLVNIVECF